MDNEYSNDTETLKLLEYLDMESPWKHKPALRLFDAFRRKKHLMSEINGENFTGLKDFFARMNPKNYYEPLIYTPKDFLNEMNPKNWLRPSGRYIPDYEEDYDKLLDKAQDRLFFGNPIDDVHGIYRARKQAK